MQRMEQPCILLLKIINEAWFLVGQEILEIALTKVGNQLLMIVLSVEYIAIKGQSFLALMIALMEWAMCL